MGKWDMIIGSNDGVNIYFRMSAELMLCLRSIKVVALKQQSFYQLRLSVYSVDRSEFIAVLALKPDLKSSTNNSNTSEIDHSQNTFLTKRFLAHYDESVPLNEFCIFKGRKANFHVFCELLSLNGNEVSIAAQWIGTSVDFVLNSAFQIFLPSFKCTFLIDCSVHCVITAEEFKDFKTPSQRSEYQHCLFDLKRSARALQEQIRQIYQFNSKALEADGEVMGIIQKHQASKKQAFAVELLESKMTSLKEEQFLLQLKKDMQSYSQEIYQMWIKFQNLYLRHSDGQYYTQLKQRHVKSLAIHNLTKHIILVDQQERVIPAPVNNNLWFYPFEQNNAQLRISLKDFKKLRPTQVNNKRQLYVLVHGYQASSYDMENIASTILAKWPKTLILNSAVNETRTEQPIDESAHRLAIEIKNFINNLEDKNVEISFICHSLGGLIGRACLQYLQSHKAKFRKFISLCSPHLGYLSHSSNIIKASLWMLNQLKKDPSMIELSMTDNPELSKTFLYRLSTRTELEWFQEVIFIGSRQDEYVPFWSATLMDKDFYFQTENAKAYRVLFDNIQRSVDKRFVRVEVIFNEPVKDISSFIGRTAHVKILNYQPVLQLIIASCI